MFIYILPILAIIISILFVQKYMTIKEGNQNQSDTSVAVTASGQQLSQGFNFIAKGQQSLAIKWNKQAEHLGKLGDVEGEKRARMKVKQIMDNISQAMLNGVAPPPLPSDLTSPPGVTSPPGTAPPPPPPGVPSPPTTQNVQVKGKRITAKMINGPVAGQIKTTLFNMDNTVTEPNLPNKGSYTITDKVVRIIDYKKVPWDLIFEKYTVNIGDIFSVPIFYENEKIFLRNEITAVEEIATTTSSATTSTSQANSAQAAAQAAAQVTPANATLEQKWYGSHTLPTCPEGVQTNTAKCPKNCVKPEKVNSNCTGATDPLDRRGYNDNPCERANKTIFKNCNHKCLIPGMKDYKNLMPANMADYKVELHGCRYDSQCNDCGRVAVDISSSSGIWEYVKKGETAVKRFWKQHSIKFDDSNKPKGYLQGYITKCEQERMQGTHKNSCPADLWTPEERKRKKAEALAAVKKSEGENKEEKANTVTAMSNNADTTTGNMFLDVTNPSHIGKKDMSLEDYYNRRILNNKKENRLGGSKSSYTEQYKPDNKRKIQYFNSVWKLF